MKIALLVVACLQAVAFAHPSGPLDDYDIVEVRRAKHSNDNDTTIKTEHLPNFKTKCVCPAPICDPRQNAKSICGCKAAAAQACYLKSAAGCPAPKLRAC